LLHAPDGLADEQAYDISLAFPARLNLHMARYSLGNEALSSQLPAATGMAQDEGINAHRPQKASQLKWDRKTKRFGGGGAAGADDKKMIRTESGVSLPASYRSGRYDAWRKALKKPYVARAEVVSSTLESKIFSRYSEVRSRSILDLKSGAPAAHEGAGTRRKSKSHRQGGGKHELKTPVDIVTDRRRITNVRITAFKTQSLSLTSTDGRT